MKANYLAIQLTQKVKCLTHLLHLTIILFCNFSGFSEKHCHFIQIGNLSLNLAFNSIFQVLFRDEYFMCQNYILQFFCQKIFTLWLLEKYSTPLSPAVDIVIILHINNLVIPKQLVELNEGLPDLLLLPSLLLDQVLIQLKKEKGQN